MKIILMLSVLLIAKFSFAQNDIRENDKQETLPYHTFQLKEGDFIFQDLDCGDLCDAIEKVTEGVDGINFSHIGLVHIHDDKSIYIIEAIGDNVRETKLDLFLKRNLDSLGKAKCVVGRLTDSLQQYIPEAVRLCLNELGKPYDDPFLINNGKWYCSELLATEFNAAAHREVFSNAPMTFKDPSTGEFFPAWIEYYKKLGVKIPEGEPGCNPGLMSRSKYLVILKPYSLFR